MNRAWILVAHRSGAWLYEQERPGGELRRVQEIPHPEGRLKNREIASDKSGRLFDSAHSRHTTSKIPDPKEQIAIEFAKHLADVLQQGRTANSFQHLVLVANPRFLGQLRAALDIHTAKLISGSLDKDLTDVAERELPDHLQRLLKK
ncbi:MAG: host attachment protein [Acidiferrobacterales bacterium]